MLNAISHSTDDVGEAAASAVNPSPAPLASTPPHSTPTSPLWFSLARLFSLPPLPFDAAHLQPFPHQVAGHGLHTPNGLLSLHSPHQPPRVLKPLSPRLKGYIEVAFYRHLSLHPSPLHSFIPPCHGVVVFPSPPTPSPLYLVLDDLTSPFSHPSILDLKMGTQTFDEAASAEKVEAETRKFPHQRITGCRIAGLRTFHPTTSTYSSRTKEWCRALSPTTLCQAITDWLTCKGELPLPLQVMSSLLVQLRALRALLVSDGEYRFYSSSLLLLFDGTDPSKEAVVRMIDFTHVFGKARAQWLSDLSHPSDAVAGMRSMVEGWRLQAQGESGGRGEENRVDVGYITGLNTVIDLLRGIADTAHK